MWEEEPTTVKRLADARMVGRSRNIKSSNHGPLCRQWMLNAKGSALLNRPRPYSVRLPYTLTLYIPVHSTTYTATMAMARRG